MNPIVVHYLRIVDENPQLAKRAPLAPHFERLVSAELRSHPGRDKGRAGSDKAVLDEDSTHRLSHVR